MEFNLEEHGFTIVKGFFSDEELDSIEFLDKFYEVLVDKRIVLVKLEDKFQNSPN